MGLEETNLALSPVTVIHGPNERGKTRLLEAVRHAILGKCGADRPVTLGAEGAELRLEADMVGEKIVILRQLTADGKTLKLIVERGPEGKMVREKGRVQEFLNGLVRPYQVDIMAFFGEKPADQRGVILSTITDVHYDPLERIEGVDYCAHPLEVIAAEVDVLFRRRAKLNSDVEDKQRFAAGAEAEIPAGFEAEVVRATSSKDLAEHLSAARQNNDALAKLDENIRMRERDVEQLEGRLRTERLNLQNARVRREEMTEIALAPLEGQFAALDAARATLQIHDAAHQARQDAVTLERQADDLTGKITALRRRDAALLAQSKTAIEGLGVNAEGAITIHDLPLTNLSGEQRINLALQVARATHGEIPLLLVDNLDALDSEHRALLVREALASGMQWLMAYTAEGEFEVEYLESEDDLGVVAGGFTGGY